MLHAAAHCAEVPYSGKLSKEKTFTNWWKKNNIFHRENFHRLLCAKGCHAPKISWRKLSRIATKLWNLKFSRSKVFRYTVTRWSISNVTLHQLHVHTLGDQDTCTCTTFSTQPTHVYILTHSLPPLFSTPHVSHTNTHTPTSETPRVHTRQRNTITLRHNCSLP